ncbi:MAG: bifunctional YncE family protein/alkaline phosphatase family protein [Gemmataceae bacterium]
MMNTRSLVAAFLLIGGGIGLFAALGTGGDPAARRTLPGLTADGFVQLPNQWRLRPAGTQIELGDFPVHAELHPSGQWLAVLHAGFGDHEIAIVALKGARPRVVSRARIEQSFYGLCFTADGKRLFASGGEYEVVHQFDFNEGYLANPKTIAVAEQTDKFVPGGIAVDAAGQSLFVCGTWGSAVVRVPLDNPGDRIRIPLVKAAEGAKHREANPYACVLDKTGKRLFVSLWNRAAVAVVDLDTNKVAAEIQTESHPTEMLLSSDGVRLYVACANSTKVSVIDTEKLAGVETIWAALYPKAPSGNTPNSLALTPDGKMLFVANADSNNVAVFNVEKEAAPLGFIPVGHYPTSVRFNATDERLYVTNGKGVEPKANPHGPVPNLPGRLQPLNEYIGGLYRGTLSSIDLPDPVRLARYSKQAFACSPLREDNGVVGEVPAGSPIPAKLGDKSPIKHCIYIIKENRTYDQVFGDMKEGRGAPELCLFGEDVTPNHHKLAREFVLLDNIYADGEVSADGHEWSMGAYATDYVEKYWPVSYRGSPFKKFGYPSEGAQDEQARPSGGYLWDRCAEAGVSYRSYGEWIHNGKTPKDPAKASVPALEGHFDPWFVGFDMDYPDQKRADRFIAELGRMEKDSDMPALVILRLPNDHTAGTRVGKPTPRAYVADNDLALGRVVEAVSKSKFWKDTAIFVIEDDAQNGPDHVDAHRVVSLVISPYTKRKFVDSTMYSTTSLLRTMELILGLQPMSQFDAAARPMYNAFQPAPDLQPYAHAPAKIDFGETNKPDAWGAKLSEEFNLAKEDMADDLLFNEVIWRSVRGPHSRMPPPVRAAFVRPHVKHDD